MTSPLVLKLSGQFATSFAAEVLHAALVLLLVAFLLRLLPRTSAATRSLIWTGVLFVLLAMPFLPLGMAGPAALPQAAHSIRFAPMWSLAVVAVSLAASLARAIGLAAGAARLRRIWLSAEPVREPHDGQDRSVLSIRTAGGFLRTARLCVSSEVGRPSVIGFFAPRIVIPASLYPGLSACELDHIVLHEMEHLRRLDDWRNLLQKLALVIFPLNPALLWIDRRLGVERELACDESVLEATRAPKSYASCLVHLAEESAISRPLALALGAWERRSELARRIHGILGYRFAEATGRGYNRTSAAALVTASLVLGAALAHTPRFITFAAPSVASASTAAALPMHLDYAAAVAEGRAGRVHVVEAVAHMPAHARTVRLRQDQRRFARDQRISQRLHRVAAARRTAQQFVLTSWVVSLDGTAVGELERPRLIFTVFKPSSKPSASPQALAPIAFSNPALGGFIVIPL